MPYTQDLSDCFADEIGDGGLSPADYDRYLDGAWRAVERLRGVYAEQSLPLLRLPENRDDLPAIREAAERFRAVFDDVVVLGTGGSSLGGRTLYSIPGVAPGNPAGGPRLHFMDNVDPHTFDGLIAALDWARTGVIAISKSGSTPETILQLGALIEVLEATVGEDKVSHHLLAITEPRDNAMSVIAGQYGCETLPHDPNVGGRYSVLSVTGMLPAAIAGLDIDALRDGAQETMETLLSSGNAANIPPAAGAAVSIGLNRTKGAGISVLMPYSDRLANFGLWYCQLWAESLGKQGEGTTPVRAIGTVDQHSQLQLYLDGPADKMFTLMLTDVAGKGPAVPKRLSDIDGLSYLENRHMGDMLAMAGRATAETLANNGRPTRLFHVPTVDEKSMGALMMHFMMETIIAADLIGVDAFDQPAVEEGKILTREFLAGVAQA